MRLSLLICLSIALLCQGCISTSTHTPEDQSLWTPLFDGETLDGWHIACKEADREKTYWTVADGAIQCDSLGDPKHDYIWLVSDREYDDFELRLKFQCYKTSKGNSGVQVRSRYDANDKGGWLNGPQVDIHPPNPFRTGLIYDETRNNERWVYPSLPNWAITPEQAFPDGKPEGWSFVYADDPETKDAWNDLHIRCEGTRIVTTLNGITIADYDGKGELDDANHRQHNVGMTGQIALQLHNRDELLIRFKDIEVRGLD